MTICKSEGPGPGAYKLKPLVGECDHDFTKYKNPAYSFGIKPPLKAFETTPAPYAYKVKECTPKYSMAPKLPIKRESIGPGPAAYGPKCESSYPAWSFGMRKFQSWAGADSPGPAAYKLPPQTSYPIYSMRKKPPLLSELPRSPGPAQYCQTNLDMYKRAPPKYTMRPKLMQKFTSDSPGPAAYKPTKSKCREPGFSFGVKHACGNKLLITLEDNFPCF